MDLTTSTVTAKESEVDRFLELFTAQNLGRSTRLGVFEVGMDAVTDYWLESGLPLVNIIFDRGHRLPACRITVGEITHVVLYAARLSLHFSLNGGEDGLDVVDQEGRTTVLRFEHCEPRTA